MKITYWIYADRKNPKPNEPKERLCGCVPVAREATSIAIRYFKDNDYENIRIELKRYPHGKS